MFNLLLIFQLASISILFVEAAYIFIHWRTRLQGVLFF